MALRMPNPALADVLLPAYSPCRHFLSHGGSCRQAVWDPERGHIPRGYLGATGELSEIQVVMVCAEPGHPYERMRFSSAASPPEMLRAVIGNSYHHHSERTDLFHKNARRFLDLAFPSMCFDEQLRRAWLTEGRLCGIENEIGDAGDFTCADVYLRSQLQLLRKTAVVVGFGKKAHRNLAKLGVDYQEAFALAPPGCNSPLARPSWEAAAAMVRESRSTAPSK